MIYHLDPGKPATKIRMRIFNDTLPALGMNLVDIEPLPNQCVISSIYEFCVRGDAVDIRQKTYIRLVSVVCHHPAENAYTPGPVWCAINKNIVWSMRGQCKAAGSC